MKLRHALGVLGVGLCTGPMLTTGVASAAPTHGATGHSFRTSRVVGAPLGPNGSVSTPVAMGSNNAGESTNWSGYADTGQSYSTVTSSWIQPAATCASGENSYSSFWVGLDGDGSQTVEQTGTDADCSTGKPTYYAWYEFFNAADPAGTPSYDYTDPVKPGDQFTATSTYQGGTSYNETITDNTEGWSESTNGTDAGTQASAEVIAEAPSSVSGSTLQRLPLANFGKVDFAGSTVNSQPFGSVGNTNALNMYNSSRTTEDASASDLSGGTNFTDTWLASD